MKKFLALALCFCLASTAAVSAQGRDKREKKRRKAEAKVLKQQAKVERQINRGAGRRNWNRPVDRGRIQAVVVPNRSRELRQLARERNQSVRRRGPANFYWSYNEARRHHNRGLRRDRNWYRSRYNRFALFAGGYYYFDRGYWYPAYGYDPVYSTYRFNEPIYGYNYLAPGQVIANVQRELRLRGYYRGSIDGLIGPMTRSALARYQRDRGLYVTRAIDGPTLAALGLI